ncbi:hypothetical protein BSKO_00349 [Bryopsis sp. KO-2023]|nr:hypothetical protein BSKO_00349 [Bryopsis sp. KO-2023]
MENLGISTSDIDGGDLKDEKYSMLATAGDWAFRGCCGRQERGGWGSVEPSNHEGKRLPYVVGIPNDKTRDHLANAVRELFRQGLTDKARKGLLVFEGDPLSMLPRLNERFMDSNLEEDWCRDPMWDRDVPNQNGVQEIQMMKWRKVFERQGGKEKYNIVRVQRVNPTKQKELIPCKVVQSGNKTIFRFSTKHGLTEQGFLVKVKDVHPSIDGIHCVDERLSMQEFAVLGLPYVQGKLLPKEDPMGKPVELSAAIVTVLSSIESTRIVYHIHKRTEYPWELDEVSDSQGWKGGATEKSSWGGTEEKSWGENDRTSSWQSWGGTEEKSWGNDRSSSWQSWGGTEEKSWGNERSSSWKDEGRQEVKGIDGGFRQQRVAGGSGTAGFGGLGQYAWGRDGSESGQSNKSFFGYTNRQPAAANSEMNPGKQQNHGWGNHVKQHQQQNQQGSGGGWAEWEAEGVSPVHSGVDWCTGKQMKKIIGPENRFPGGGGWGVAKEPQKEENQQQHGIQPRKSWNLQEFEGCSCGGIGMELMDLCGREQMGKFLVQLMPPGDLKKILSNFSSMTINSVQRGAAGLTFQAADFQKDIALDVTRKRGNWMLRLPHNRILYMVAELMRQYFLSQPHGRVLILVQKSAQGAGYLGRLEMFGFDRVGLRAQIFNAQSTRLTNWTENLHHQSIMIMTPQLFLNNITTNSASFSDFGLVILDECEFAVGMNSACMLMNRFDELSPQEKENVQVVGITSTELMSHKHICRNLRVSPGEIVMIPDLDPCA